MTEVTNGMKPFFKYEYTVGGEFGSVLADRYDTQCSGDTVFKEWYRDPVFGQRQHVVLRVRIDPGSLLRLPAPV
jgi:hypothetical protein